MAAPSEPITLTIHVIRSFEYRTIKYIVLKSISPTLSLSSLRTLIQNHIQTTPQFTPFRRTKFDTLRILLIPHGELEGGQGEGMGAKSNNLVDINENGEVLEGEEKELWQFGLVNETELSLYEGKQWEEYQKNPVVKW
eukprot:CAMPEP_0201534654 /NCGR_PEP_ID=MMETSP0161_2-20130828/56896_1 /ASSEMBLY_ACC=CAM_ASM_000251 /TAXON_ID=180227 /ORGANISM="Neoparamoeba aestuarina, Strain SoJaBio B1-5/56/2" /LENGTH=137 /DNA_ID=CAMNT_0047939413 /DNA_START=28 /DNA_END=441 /DNA_ORIENTATION=+